MVCVHPRGSVNFELKVWGSRCSIFVPFFPRSSRIAIVCIPNHLHQVVHVESNIWYEFRGSQRLCTGLSRKWKAENGSKMESVKTVIEDEVEELRERSFAKKSLRTSALFSL